MYCKNLGDKFFDNPIIAAVRDMEDLEVSLQSKVSSIFLLTGSLLNIKKVVDQCLKENKNVFLHIDMIEGLASDIGAIRYLAEDVRPSGIISTRNNIIKHAKEYGFFTIQRYFCVDSLALNTGIKSIEQADPHAVELLPGIIPRVVAQVVRKVKKPIITGGMVTSKTDVIEALNAGAAAVSTSCKELWNK